MGRDVLRWIGRRFLVCMLLGLAASGVAPIQAPAQSTYTWDRIIGAMCIQGIPSTARKVRNVGNDNGVQVEVFDIDYVAPSKGPRATVRVFRAPPVSNVPLARCGELTGDVILEGEVKTFKVTGGRETLPGASQAILRIEPDALNVEIVKAKSGLAPLYGGILQLGSEGAILGNSGRAWIDNRERIIAVTGQPMQGSVDVESWGRKLTGLKLVLPGAVETSSLDMTSGNGNIIIRVPLGGGPTELRSGMFVANKVAYMGSTVALPGAAFSAFSGTAGTMQLIADKTGVVLKVNDLNYGALTSELTAVYSKVSTGNSNGSIKLVQTIAPRSGAMLTLSDTRVSGLSSNNQACDYRFAQARLAVVNACRVTVVDAGTDNRHWEFDTIAPNTLMAGGAVSTKGKVTFSSVVAGNSERFSGRIENASVKIGAFELEGNSVSLVDAKVSADRISIPFQFDAPPKSGSWNVRLQDKELALTGRLDTLRGKGTISVDVLKPSDWAIDVGKDDLAFDGAVTATFQPYLYGAKPSFGSLSLSLNADSSLHVDQNGAAGKIGAGAQIMTVADLIFQLGEKEGAMVLTGPRQFDGAVALDFDLASGKAVVDSGRLDVRDVKLRTLPNKPGDLGSVRLWQGEVTLARLTAEFKNGAGTMEASNLSVMAQRLESLPLGDDAGSGNQLVWSGAMAKPTTVGTISGSIVHENQSESMKVAAVGLKNLQVSLRDIRMGQGKALHFSGGQLDVGLSDLRDENIVGTIALRDSRIAADTTDQGGNQTDADILISALALNITGGTPAAPDGNGLLQTMALNLNTDSQIEIKESCDGQSDFQGLPIRVSVQTGPMGIRLSMAGGNIKGKGAAAVVHATIKDRGQYECRAKVINWTIIKEQRAVYDYPCPTWSSPFRTCRGWTILVPELKVGFDRLIRIRHFYAEGVFTSVGLDIDGLGTIKKCGKLGAFVPLADISYFVTPRTNIGIADSIFQEVIDATSRPFSSALVSGIGTTVGSIYPQTSDGLCV